MKPVYVWTFPTRLFHWILVVLILAAWISSWEERWLDIHAAIGISLGVLFLFRILWGVVGPRYSRFIDFDFNLSHLREYLLHVFNPRQDNPGHNPAASYVMTAMLIIGVLSVVSGMLTYGITENHGMFACLHSAQYLNMDWFEELHELLVNMLWVLIAAHIAGVLLHRWVHPQDRTLSSIVDGYKQGEGKGATLNGIQKTVAFIGIGGALAVLAYTLFIPDNRFVAAYTPKIDYEKENSAFVSECASCHTLYPPTLLPKESWRKLMGNLENHFGDDVSLDPADHQSILAYLINHSAETSQQEMSVKMLQSFQNRDIIVITHTPFWKKMHQSIPSGVFTSNEVKSPANCKACHSDIEQGRIEDNAIKPLSKG